MGHMHEARRSKHVYMYSHIWHAASLMCGPRMPLSHNTSTRIIGASGRWVADSAAVKGGHRE